MASGKVNRTIPLPADSNNMGYSSFTLDDLCNEPEFNQRNGISRPEKISFQNANYLGKQNYDNGTSCIRLPNSSEYNGINERREDRKIYISLQRNNNRNNNGKNTGQEQPINSNGKDGKYSDIKIVPLSCCSNRKRICDLQVSLEKLCRVGTFTGNAQTKENLETPCNLVVLNA